MSLKIDRLQLEIEIKQDAARQKVLELEQSMREANKTLRKIKKDFGENSKEYKVQIEIIKQLQQQYDDLYDEIGLANLSIRELGKRQKELNLILRNLNPNSESYRRYREELDAVNLRIKEIKGTATETRLSLSKLADGFNRYAGLGASVIASLTGVALTARKCVDEFAEMKEAESQVVKYTGMTEREVALLNEELKRMDTRTSREELNRLAGEAGRLGIQSREEVLKFVQAADMINVALGEDLGEDAIKNIGKLAQMFGDASRDMKGNMLAIGSAVNSVAQNSSAAEPYLVEFAARMGGVAKQAKMSITDVMGFASALDQNMLRSEMASTALQGLILKIYQEPAKYAKLAGLDVKKFSDLLATDVNEAVLTFLEQMNRLGGMGKMAPVLKEMSLSGAEAAGVISALAGNIEKVRKEQQQANQAYTDGTSIINEFGVQNSTVQAELDKAKKRFTEIRVELGEQLLPVMKYMVTTGSLTVKGLSTMVSILLKYKTAILAVSATIGAYTLGVKAVTLWEKRHQVSVWLNTAALKAKNLWTKTVTASELLYIAAKTASVGWTQASTRALKLFFNTIKLNPVGLLVSAVVALGMGMHSLISKTKESKQYLSDFFAQMETERSVLSKTYRSLIGTAEGTLARRDAIEEFNKKYGQYLPNLLSEKSTLEELKKAYNDVALAMQSKIAQQILSRETEKLQSDSVEKSSKTLSGLQDTLSKALTGNQLAKVMPQIVGYVNEFVEKGYNAEQISYRIAKGLSKSYDAINLIMKNGGNGADVYHAVKGQLKNYAEQVIETAQKVDKVRSRLNPFINPPANSGKASNELPEVVVTPNSGAPYTTSPDDAFKAREEALKKSLTEEQNALKTAHLLGLLSEEEYQDGLYRLQIKYLSLRKQALDEFGKDSSDIEGQLLDAMIAEADRKTPPKMREIKSTPEPEEEIEEDTYELDKFRDTYDGKLAVLNAFHEAGIISEREYQDRLTALNKEEEEKRMQESEQRRQAFAQTANAVLSSASQFIQAMQDQELSKVQRRYDKQIKEAKKAGKDTTKLEEEKEQAMADVKKKYADKMFAMNVLQITATTAVTAMEAYKSMAGIPVVGPALGAAAAAAAVIAGAAQIAVAKKNRDEAKGLKSGGYSADYVEGYTDRGNPDDVAGVIPVHKNEFVTNHLGVANPHVRQFLDVFDTAQRNGTIGMINTTQILEQVRTRTGRYDGGFTEPASPSDSPSGTVSMDALLRLILETLRTGNTHLQTIAGKELTVDVRAVRDGIRRVDRLEANASR